MRPDAGWGISTVGLAIRCFALALSCVFRGRVNNHLLMELCGLSYQSLLLVDCSNLQTNIRNG